MNKESYVTYQQAADLYNLDFDWDCELAYYYHAWMNEPRLAHFTVAHKEARNYDGTDVYFAPTLSMAQKWLREVKEIDVLVFNCACGYGWEISKAGNEQSRGTTIMPYDDNGEDEASGMWLSYEAALSAGINKCLTLLMENRE